MNVSVKRIILMAAVVVGLGVVVWHWYFFRIARVW